MKKNLLLLSFLAFPFGLLAQDLPLPVKKEGLQIRFSKNIEVMGFTFFLGSYGQQLMDQPEANNSAGVKNQDWNAYAFAFYEKYFDFKTDPDLQKLTSIEENTEGAAMISFLLLAEDFPNATFPEDLPEKHLQAFAPGRSLKEARQIAQEFLDCGNRLYKHLNFENYFRDNKAFYDTAIAELLGALPSDQAMEAVQAFYRKRFDAYVLMPSLTIPPGMGFGVNTTAKGKTTIYNVFGSRGVQQLSGNKALKMGFSDENMVRELSTHEFGHSFTNPVLDKLPDALFRSSEKLFGPLRQAMSNQAYNTWKICLYEHFVRAAEVLIARRLGKTKNADILLNHYVKDRKFIYLPELISILEHYEKDPKMSYATAAETFLKQLALKAKQN
ncbi:DUF4932 domain-containing protein [Pedobacter nutrimenti]|uniref:Uncharacterized protein DUF4932 n=1 Tax=Pedobacter nutrimenti TaxID=1241337 RepID=A0A318UDI9_9SPHI|nr:DUF4932 domain-containing protein [Pedobacter nutrimenti]PYF74464.1 uncharacterized protein DUF4932 [Pedobacter nutrimenti]